MVIKTNTTWNLSEKMTPLKYGRLIYHIIIDMASVILEKLSVSNARTPSFNYIMRSCHIQFVATHKKFATLKSWPENV